MGITVSIIIKALNEQNNIAQTLHCALVAASEVNGEVVLADSGSTDSTVDIAQNFPITIVQLNNFHERSCGIGAQLGYQYARGEFIYILDADMEIQADFLRQALSVMSQDPQLAGVGGLLKEMHLENLEFQARVQRMADDMQAGDVGHLSGGGLYRKSAITQVGYLTNRNLHAYEEFELGIRLRYAGWKLIRLPIIAVKHYGHTISAYALLKKRWASRYTHGSGEILRSALGKPYISQLLSELKELRLYLIVIMWWIALFFSFAGIDSLQSKAIILTSLLALPFIAMSIKKRNIQLGIYSVVAWQYLAAGLLLGVIRKQTDPALPISSRILKSSANTQA